MEQEHNTQVRLTVS